MKMKENFVEADGYREKSIQNDVSDIMKMKEDFVKSDRLH